MITNFIQLDFNKENDLKVPSVQYDSGSRFVKIKLQRNKSPFEIDGYRVTVVANKVDGTEIMNDCTILDGVNGIVQFEITEQFNAVEGVVDCQLKLFKGETLLTSMPFSINVVKSVSTKEIVSSNELKTLVNALGEVQDIDNRFELTNQRISDIKEHCTGGNATQNHSHINKTVLDKLDEHEGELYFDGNKLGLEIANGSITPEMTSFIDVNKEPNRTVNILDISDLSRDKYVIHSTGGLADRVGLHVTSFIKVKPNTAYIRTQETLSYIDTGFYTKDKTFIRGVYSASAQMFTTPANCWYIRTTVDEAHLNTTMIVEGDELPDHYIPNAINMLNGVGVYTNQIVGTIDLDNLPSNVLLEESLKVGINQLGEDVISGNNLFDKEQGESGYLNFATGIVVSSAKNWASDFIPCIPGQTYYKVGVSSNEVNDQDICFYDSEKRFISGFVAQSSAPDTWRSFTIPEGGYYFRFDMLVEYRDTEFVSLLPNVSVDGILLNPDIKVSKDNIIENNEESEYVYQQPYIFNDKGVKYSLNVAKDGSLYVVPNDLSHVPSDMNKFTTTGKSCSVGDILVTPHTDNSNVGWLFVLDNNFCVKKYKKLSSFAYSFRKHKNSAGEIRYTYAQTVNKEHPKIPQNGGYDNTKLVVADEDLETLYEYKLKAHGTVTEGHPGENHEYIYFDDNHYMMLAYVGAVVNNIPEHSGSYKAVNCVIQEVKNNQVVFHWESIEHPELYTYSCFNKDFTNFPSTQNIYNDYCHMNGFMVDPLNENHLIVSFRGTGLVKIDKTTGDILWLFGRGGRIDFEGMTADQTPYLQHHATRLDDGSIICFDNSGCATNNTRICRYWLDEENMELIDFKQYVTKHPRSRFMGSVDMVKEGVFLINYGGAYSGVTFEEYDFNKNRQNMSFTFSDGTDCYRVWKDVK